MSSADPIRWPLGAPSLPLPAAVPSAGRTLGVGLLRGFALGVTARLWMRMISQDPEFTWGGTLFIVIGFTIFSTAQGVVVVSRRRPRSRAGGAAARLLGILGLLPLFVAAGAVMFPTVVAGGLAAGQVTWPSRVRVGCLALALAPVGFVAFDLVGSFGWNWRAIGGTIGLLGVYGLIVTIARPSFSAPCGLAPLPRWVRWSMAGVGGLALVASLGLGGVG